MNWRFCIWWRPNIGVNNFFFFFVTFMLSFETLFTHDNYLHIPIYLIMISLVKIPTSNTRTKVSTDAA